MTLISSRVYGNSAEVGGGINVRSDSCATLTFSTISNNSAKKYNGGGLIFRGDYLEVSDCKIIGNTTVLNGGGLCLYSSGFATIINCTLSGNQCGESYQGGGIYIYNSFSEITNTIFEGHDNYAIYESDSDLSNLSHCLFFNNPDGDSNGNFNAATNCVSGDPLFVDAANGDFHLQDGSAAIDCGTSISAPATDMDGVARPVDRYGVGYDGENEGYDIGAYECLFAGIIPDAPSDVAATSATTQSITWGWQDNSDNETGFTIYFTSGTELSWTVADTLTTNTTSWTTSSLAVNTQYTLGVRAFNNMGARYCAQGDGWTLALPPVAPTLSNPTPFSLDVTIGAGDGNPAYTKYAVYCDTMGLWAQANGTLGSSKVWQTAANWGTATISGLSGGTLHRIAVMARNGDGIESALGPAAEARTQMTLTYNAAPCGIIEGDAVQWIDYGGDGSPVTAVPVLGNFFVDWSDGLTTTTRVDTNITTNLNFTANFNPGVAWILCK